jgi:AmmeMemoRadiSam system protein A
MVAVHAGQPGAADGCGLSADERQLLLRVARHALMRAFGLAGAVEIDPAAAIHPQGAALQAPRAVFVTLWRRDTGELRGCRGECTPSQPLVAAVAAMACAAAFDDGRFLPVTAEELSHICIEISVLSPLTPIQPASVAIGRHGLLIVAGHRRGLLLPQVPVEHGMDRDQFLAALCSKAGLAGGAWRKPGVELYGFETECWQE